MGTYDVRIKLFIVGVLTTAGSVAKSRDMTPFMFPTAPLFTSAIGPVFPGPGSTAVGNAAALTTNPPQHTLTFINSVAAGGGGDFGVNVGYSWANEKVGFAAGYAGTMGSTTEHGYFGGASLKMGRVSTGVAAYQVPGTTGSPGVDVAISAPLIRKDLFVTAQFKNVVNEIQPIIGTGQRFDRFQYEVWFELPPFSNLPRGYNAGLGFTFGLGKMGVQAAAVYETVSGNVNYTGGIGFWAGEDAHISIQYDSSQRVNAGVNLPL